MPRSSPGYYSSSFAADALREALRVTRCSTWYAAHARSLERVETLESSRGAAQETLDSFPAKL
eukprot:9486940-Pyramimonas_sp.AAC.1